MSIKVMQYGFLALCLGTMSASIQSAELGSVDTKWRALSPDDKISLEVFDDDKIGGIACYLSKAETGGYSGALGFAEDTSDASLDCQQVGPITIKEEFKKGELVFRERRSLIFKSMKVLRFCDVERNVLVYLVYSERVIEGSPKNSVSAVPIAPWGSDVNAAMLPRCNYSG